MDNVTHSLVGLMMSRVSSSNARSHAWMMVVAANFPDIDTVAWFGGPLTYLDWHRGYAHSLIAAPLLAALVMLLFGARSIRAWALCLIGVFSHLVLDWTNVYGIRMLLPFSHDWLRLDITDVVDPWILLVLLLAVAAPALAGLVGSEIGAKRSHAAKRGWAWFALIVLLAYEGARFAAHNRAINVMSARLYNGTRAKRITALPLRWSVLQWRGVAEGDGYISEVPVDLTTDFDPSAGHIDYASPAGPAIEAAKSTLPFEVFGRFNQLPFWKVTGLADETTQVQLIDLRFGTPAAPGFEAVAILEPSGAVRESKFHIGVPPVKAD